MQLNLPEASAHVKNLFFPVPATETLTLIGFVLSWNKRHWLDLRFINICQPSRVGILACVASGASAQPITPARQLSPDLSASEFCLNWD